MVQKEIEFLKAKQERIEKMHVLTVLQEEKNMIEDVIRYQDKVEMKLATDSELDPGQDICKLKEISQQQQEQLKVSLIEIQPNRTF